MASRRAPIHLLITDVVMPGETGPQLAQTLMARRPGLRVIYMSGFTDEVVVRSGTLRADATGQPIQLDAPTVGQWFNTGAFAQPAPFTFGNSGRGVLRGDGVVTVDVSLAKNVALGAARTLQLRVEAFNAFNHPNFGLPGHAFGAPNFGVVSSASEGRTIQLGLRFVY
jgi:hypothetical protein